MTEKKEPESAEVTEAEAETPEQIGATEAGIHVKTGVRAGQDTVKSSDFHFAKVDNAAKPGLP